MNESKSIHIPEPCHENWEDMSLTDKGRHCDSCVKEVVDFSDWNHNDIIHYLDNSDGMVCGRIKKSQLASPEPTLIDLIPNPAKNFARAAAIAAVAFFHSDATMAQTLGHEERVPALTEDRFNKTSTLVKGIVRDELNEALPFAAVYYESESGESHGIMTDVDGKFELTIPAEYASSGTVDLIISFIGYSKKTLKGVCLDRPVVSIDSALKFDERVPRMVGFVVVTEKRSFLKRPVKTILDKIGLRRGSKKMARDHEKSQKKDELENTVYFECDPIDVPDVPPASIPEAKPEEIISRDEPEVSLEHESAETAEPAQISIDLPMFSVVARAEEIERESTTVGAVYMVGGLSSCYVRAENQHVEVNKDENLEHDDYMTIFPNPTSDWLTIMLSDKQNLDYVISDLSGSLIETGQIVFGTKTVETSWLSHGTYIISLFDKERVVSTKQFVVTR